MKAFFLKLVASAAVVFALGTAAQAETCDKTTHRTESGQQCFVTPAGTMWIVTSGGNGADFSKLYMSADADVACPGHRIKLEASKLGPKMDKAQKFRGDSRVHIVCDRSAPPAAAAAPVAPLAAPAQRSERQPGTIDVRYLHRL